MKITLLGHAYDDCLLDWPKYKNKQQSLQIRTQYDELLMTASVCLPSIDVPTNHILIKDYSENTGILACLIENKVLTDTGVTIPSGFVQVNLCKLTEESLQSIKETAE